MITEQNVANRQGLNSDKPENSLKLSTSSINRNFDDLNLQDKNSHPQLLSEQRSDIQGDLNANAQEVQARAVGNPLIINPLPLAQVEIPEQAIAIQNDQNHAPEIQHLRVNELEQQVQGLKNIIQDLKHAPEIQHHRVYVLEQQVQGLQETIKNMIQDQKHAPEIQHHRVNELEQQVQGLKNLIQDQRHAPEIQHHRVNVLDQYQNVHGQQVQKYFVQQGIKKFIKKQMKPRQNYYQQYNQRQTQWDYESDSQSDQYDSQYNGYYKVVRTQNGQKYHKVNCEVAQEYGIAEQFPIFIARKRNYRPCQRCFT